MKKTEPPRILSVAWVPRSPPAPVPGFVRILDQTLLPGKIAFIETTDPRRIWEAIRSLRVRGAPAIGVAAAMGTAAAAQNVRARSGAAIAGAVARVASYLATSRPTAVNLFWALERMRRTAAENAALSPPDLRRRLVEEALAIRDEDAAMCRAIGEHGLALLRNGCSVLTHCNAGALATAEFGTALAPVYAARQRGWKIHVYVDETRPLLQGARLTAWELSRAGVPVTLLCDNMAAVVMKKENVAAVLVGADRIAANGDTANKIGTYGLAILARAHRIPFYVLAPTSTFDFGSSNGDAIPIEYRSGEEVTHVLGKPVAPRGIRAYSPAFDVTPSELISAIVCEAGIARPPFNRSLAKIAAKAGPQHDG